MKEILFIFLLVATVSIVVLTKDYEEYNFPTTEAVLHRCATDEDCGNLGWCENVDGRDGGTDGRRGRQCRAKFHQGVSCFGNVHCRSGHCNHTTKKCDNRELSRIVP